MIKNLKHSIKAASRQWKVILFIYLIQAVIALTIGLQVYQVMEASIGMSTSLDIIAGGFNRTVFTDLFNVHGASLSPLIGLMRWIVVLYAVISIFLHGGLLSNLISGYTDLQSFVKNGFRFFFSFLKVAILTMIIITIWIGLLTMPYLMIIGDNPFEKFANEIPLILWTITYILLIILGIGFIWVWSIHARARLIKTRGSLWYCVKSGLQQMRGRLPGLAIIFIFLISVYGVSLLLYTLIMKDRGAESLTVIFIMIIIQQVFAFYRIWLKTIGYNLVLHTSSSPQNN